MVVDAVNHLIGIMASGMGLGLYQVFKGSDGKMDIEVQCEYAKRRPNDKRQVSVVGDC